MTPVERVRAALCSADAIPSGPKVSKVLRLLGPALDVLDALGEWDDHGKALNAAFGLVGQQQIDTSIWLHRRMIVKLTAFDAAVAKEFPDA